MDEVVKSLIPSTNCFTTCETEEELLSTTKCECPCGRYKQEYRNEVENKLSRPL